ncbi:MAG TPA: flagellar biosynthetic protein FliO [Solirubrobacteraceae bacterium]|jgi:flagellar protein FliO/FliZ|nr:flagellar biosynthetic protein FliO [Solirubrobacteraceae bacterium]
MNNQISLSRVVATATAVLGCRMLAFASPAAAFSPSVKTGSESTPLNLSPSTSGSHAATASTGGASIVRTIVGLAIVIAVIWGLAWILRQVKAGKDPHLSSDGLASVAALTLGSGRSVHLVRAGSDYVLLGSTEHGVAPIHRYTEEEAREVGLLLSEPPAERRRLLGAAGQLVVGAGRAVGAVAQVDPHDSGHTRVFSAGAGERTDVLSAGASERIEHSPVVGRRPDPMAASAPSSNLIDRLRELTVRR